MEKHTPTSRAALMMALITGLAACEEAQIVTPPPPAPPPISTFKVGGSVSGLPGNGLVLQLNGADELPVGTNGQFVFPKPLNKGSTYTVTVKSSPTAPVKQTCTVNHGSGTITAATINNIAVTCVTSDYAVGGKVSGLSGKGLVIQLNGRNELAIEKNGDFIFPGVRLADGSDYSVAIKKTPANRKCKIEPISAAPDRDTLHIVSIACSKKKRR